jgi:proline iminopeptidase
MPGCTFCVALPLIWAASLFAQDGTIARDGFALHYRSEGSGTPIVFLSGGPGLEVDYFVPAAKFFPAGYRRIYLEQRGTGRSRPANLTPEMMTLRLVVEDLEALRTHLQLDRIMLAGHSWGGMLAMAYAASHPDHVDRLILIGSGGPDNEFRAWFGDNIAARLHAEDVEARAYWIAAAKRGVDPRKVGVESLKAILPGYFFDRAKGLATAAAFPDGLIHPDVGGLLNRDLIKNYSVRPTLPRLTRPVLILHGHQDPIGDKTAEDIKALLPSATLRYFNKCGHFPWIEQPEEMQAAIAAFLSQK